MALPGKQVTDFSIGYHNICRAASSGIYDLQDSTTNSLCIDMFPRYVHPRNVDDSDDESTDDRPRKINSATVLGDVFAAINHIEAEIRDIRKTLAEHLAEYGRVDHIIEHVQVLENNLRCLHETVAFDGTPVEPLQIPS